MSKLVPACAVGALQQDRECSAADGAHVLAQERTTAAHVADGPGAEPCDPLQALSEGEKKALAGMGQAEMTAEACEAAAQLVQHVIAKESTAPDAQRLQALGSGELLQVRSWFTGSDEVLAKVLDVVESGEEEERERLRGRMCS